MRVPEATIDAVREATDIVEVIGEHLPLTASGRTYKTLCPFHEEKTPSFIVTPDRQTYHCFGCGAGGNAFTFLMKHQGLGFREALELLADRAGISLPRASLGREASPPGPTSAGRLLSLLEEATRHYEHNLWELDAGAKARAYLGERGLSEATAKVARLGYALPGYDHLRKRLGRTHGIAPLIAAGLLVDRGEDRTYDRFRDRLMFPILGTGGRPLGFGARSLDGSDPKYLNSPETAVYHKREVLYGLADARRSWARQGTAWVVEGYMDVLSLHQAGLECVVGVSGTALTDPHAHLLRRHVKRVVLLFDGDEAGRGAVLRSLPPLLREGLGVEVALIAGGEDPDSLVRRGGREAIEKVVETASGVIEFIISQCRKSLSKDEARAEALRQIVVLGALLPERVGRRLFAEDGARRLGFDEATLAGEIEASWNAGKGARRGIPAGASPSPMGAAGQATAGRRSDRERSVSQRGHSAERTLLAFALGRPRIVRRIRQELALDDFTLPEHRRLVERLLERESRGEPIGPADLAGPEEEAAMASLVSALALEPIADEERDEVAGELVAKLRDRRRRQEIARLRELIREHEAAGHQDEVGTLLKRVQELIQSEPASSPSDA